jgi:uncharacterized protein YndB with AHSA1/START domain
VSTIEIARPPQEVFTYVTDPARFAEWQYDVVRGRQSKVVGDNFGPTAP